MKKCALFFSLVFLVPNFFSRVEAAASDWPDWLIGTQGFQGETETIPQVQHVRLYYKQEMFDLDLDPAKNMSVPSGVVLRFSVIFPERERLSSEKGRPYLALREVMPVSLPGSMIDLPLHQVIRVSNVSPFGVARLTIQPEQVEHLSSISYEILGPSGVLNLHYDDGRKDLMIPFLP